MAVAEGEDFFVSYTGAERRGPSGLPGSWDAASRPRGLARPSLGEAGRAKAAIVLRYERPGTQACDKRLSR